MADVKISGLTNYRPVDENVLFVGSWKEGEKYTTYSATGNEIKKFVLNGIKAKPNGGIVITPTYMEGDSNNPCSIEISTNIDTTLFTVVQTLGDKPEAGDENKIHLVKDETGGGEQNQYVEYIWNDGWEELGKFSSDVSLNGYAQESWVLDKLKTYVSSDTFNSTISGLDDTYAKLEDFNNLDKTYAKISDIPDDYLTESDLNGYATQSWVEGIGYLTEHQSLEGYAKEEWVEKKNYLTEVPDTYATKTWVESIGYLTEVPDDYATKTYVDDKVKSVDVSGQLKDYVKTSDLESNYTNNTDLAAKLGGKVDTTTLADYAQKSEVTEEISGEIAKLNKDKVGGTGKYVVSVAQANGIVTAEVNDLKAENVLLSEKIGELTAENVHSALVQLNNTISNVTQEALSISAGNGISINPDGSSSKISVNVPTTDKYLTVDATGVHTKDIDEAIAYAISESEKKIFGEGELATAFDTIKEIGDYLKDHDEVAEAINEAIATKANSDDVYSIEDADEKFATKDDLEGLDISDTLTDYVSKEELVNCAYLTSHQSLTEYAKIEYVDKEIADTKALNAWGEENATAKTTKVKINGTEKTVVTGHQDLTEYAKTSDVNKTLEDYVQLTYLESNYYTSAEVNKKISDTLAGGDLEIEGYASTQWVNDILGTEYTKTNNVTKAITDAVAQKSKVEITKNDEAKTATIKIDNVEAATVLTGFDVDLSSVDTKLATKLDKGEYTGTAKDLKDLIDSLTGRIADLEAKLSYYDKRFGYPTTGTPTEDGNGWTVSFLRID